MFTDSNTIAMLPTIHRHVAVVVVFYKLTLFVVFCKQPLYEQVTFCNVPL